MVLGKGIILFRYWTYVAVIIHWLFITAVNWKYSKFRKCAKLEQLLQIILQKIGREIWTAPTPLKGRIGKTNEQHDPCIRS